VQPAPSSHTLSPLVSPEIRLCVLVQRAWGLALAAGAGLDYVPAAPRLYYESGTDLRERPGPRVVQPRVLMAIEVRR